MRLSPLVQAIFRYGRTIFAAALARDAAILVLANATRSGLMLLQNFILAHLLRSEDFGVLTLLLSTPAVVFALFDVRSSDFSIQYLSRFIVSEEIGRARVLLRLGYLIDVGVASLFFLGIVTFSSWIVERVVHHPELKAPLVIYSLSFLPQALRNTSYALLVVQKRFRLIGFIETFVAILRFFIVIGLVFRGTGVVGAALGTAGTMAFYGLLYYAAAAWVEHRLQWKQYAPKIEWGLIVSFYKEMIRFLLYNSLSIMLGAALKQIDIPLLGLLRNPVEAGYYRLAKGVVSLLGQLIAPLQTVVYPHLARLRVEAPGRIPAFLHKLLIQAGLPLGIVTVGAGFLVWPSVFRFLGPEYASATFSALIMWLGACFWLIFFWLRPAFLSLGYVHIWFRINFVFSLIAVGLFLVLGYYSGHVGMAVARTMIHIGFHILALLWLYKILLPNLFREEDIEHD